MAPKLGSRSTAIEALRGADLKGKVAVVTGGNSGIGVETVRALASAGARVYLCSRSVENGEKVAADLRAGGGLVGEVVVLQLDLSDISNVRRFTREWLARDERVDFLVLNAGVMATPQGTTKDGFETQIGVNHFGHFALTLDLLDNLKKQGTPVRVISVSSIAHTWSNSLDVTDLNWTRRKYSPWPAYAASKIANILFASELARRCEGTGVKAYSLHPGSVDTALGRNNGFADWYYKWFKFLNKTPAQGAATSVYACVAPELEAHNGAYLSDCGVVTARPWARDADVARQLWEESEKQLRELKL